MLKRMLKTPVGRRCKCTSFVVQSLHTTNAFAFSDGHKASLAELKARDGDEMVKEKESLAGRNGSYFTYNHTDLKVYLAVQQHLKWLKANEAGSI